MEKIVSAKWKRNPIEHHKSLEGLYHWIHAITVEKKPWKPSNLKGNSWVEKTVSSCYAWLHRIYNRTSQGDRERDYGYGNKGSEGSEEFQDLDLGEIQKLVDTTSEELTEDDLVEKSASEPRPEKEEDVEEAVPKDKLT